MQLSTLSSLDTGVRSVGSNRGPLQRVQQDFANQMQSALDALEARSPEAHEAVAPVLAQVSQAVDAVFNQLQVNMAGPSSAVLQAQSAVSSVAFETSATQAPVSEARDYLLPGEPGAGLPANYLKSPLY